MAAKSKKKKIGFNLMSHGILFLLVLVCMIPIALVVINSFKAHTQIVGNPLALPDVLHLENYIQGWTSGKFARGFMNSLKLVGSTILIVLTCSTLAGYVLAGRRIKGCSGISLYFMMSMTVPIQLFLFPLYFVYANLKLIGNSPATGLILAAVYMPLSVFLMRTFFLAVPKELEEAARIDGANTAHVIWHIMAPIVSPGLLTVSVLIGLQSWNEYLISSTFLQGEKNFTALLTFLTMNGSYGANMGTLMASAVILIGPVIIFFLCVQKRFVDGVVSGAVKG